MAVFNVKIVILDYQMIYFLLLCSIVLSYEYFVVSIEDEGIYEYYYFNKCILDAYKNVWKCEPSNSTTMICNGYNTYNDCIFGFKNEYTYMQKYIGANEEDLNKFHILVKHYRDSKCSDCYEIEGITEGCFNYSEGSWKRELKKNQLYSYVYNDNQCKDLNRTGSTGINECSIDYYGNSIMAIKNGSYDIKILLVFIFIYLLIF